MDLRIFFLWITLATGISARNLWKIQHRHEKSQGNGISKLDACTDPAGIFLPVPDKCTDYALCVDGILIYFTCGGNNYFDPNLGFCVEDRENACIPRRPCSSVPNGNMIPIEGECYKYQLCIDGESIPLECKYGLLFSKELGFCILDVDGVCRDYSTTTTEEPKETTTTEEAITATTTEEPIETTTPEEPTTTEDPMETTTTEETTGTATTEKEPIESTTEEPIETTTVEKPIESTTTEIDTTTETSTVTEEPTHTVTEEPTPTVTEEPTPTVTEEPPPTVTEEPTPTVTEEPIPTVTEEPAPTVTEEPPPTVTEEPPPTVTEEPKPTVTEESTTTTEPSETQICEGISIGFVPHEDCNKFYTCMNGEATVSTCPDGNYFDRATGRCAADTDGVCLGRCSVAESGTRFPADNDCHSYFECQSGEEYALDCPTGYYFDTTTSQCIEDTDNTCGGTSPAACDGQTDGTVIPHGSCDSYFICNNNEAEVKSCDNGYRFDVQELKCIIDPQFTCFCELNTEAVFPSDNCHQYYKCEQGKASTQNCPQGEYFEIMSLGCVADQNEQCLN